MTVTDSNGGVLDVNNTAVVTSGTLFAFGRTIPVTKEPANALAATFIYKPVAGISTLTADNFAATINWGDGSVTTGTGNPMIRGAGSSFSVYGTHRYAFGTTYPVDVTIQDLNSPGITAEAWSTAVLSGLATRQPPFAQSHITALLGNPGYNGLYVDEEVTLINSGNIASGPVRLQFFVSPTMDDKTLNPRAIPLNVGKGSTYNTVSIPPGHVIEGTVSEITLPSTMSTSGMYLIMEVITSDPIGQHMAYQRFYYDPNPLLE